MIPSHETRRIQTSCITAGQSTGYGELSQRYMLGKRICVGRYLSLPIPWSCPQSLSTPNCINQQKVIYSVRFLNVRR